LLRCGRKKCPSQHRRHCSLTINDMRIAGHRVVTSSVWNWNLLRNKYSRLLRDSVL
jgi:hypothetical protein